jgi:uncharacterized membrane protein YoaK (UPF0700 family)
MSDVHHGEQVDASLLSYVAAFVDTAGFIGLFGLFTAHVTGNFVLIGSAVVNRSGELLAKLLAMPVFVLAVAATAMVARSLHRRQRSAAPALFLSQGLLLAAAAVAAAVLPVAHGADAAATIVVGMLAVAAMAVQNALMRVELPKLPPTTVMTGNVTQVVIDWVTLRAGGRAPFDSAEAAETTEAQQRIRRMGPGIVAFTLGAASGAAAQAFIGFYSLLLPAALCGLLAWRLRGRGRPSQAVPEPQSASKRRQPSGDPP